MKTRLPEGIAIGMVMAMTWCESVQGSPFAEIISTPSKPPTSVAADRMAGAGFITEDGSKVFFHSASDNLKSGVLGWRFVNLFMTDLADGSEELISEDSSGLGAASGDVELKEVSSDARYVLFESDAGNLAADDRDGVADVFLRDRSSHSTVRVSAPHTGENTGRRGASRNATMSSDGRRIVFESDATDLAPIPAGSVPFFYFHDRTVGTNQVVLSPDLGAGAAVTRCRNPMVSGDGRIVAFESSGYDLTTGEPALDNRIYVRNMTEGSTLEVSADALTLVQALPGTAASVKLLDVSEDGKSVIYSLYGVATREDNYLMKYSLADGAGAIIATNVFKVAFATNIFNVVGDAETALVSTTPDGRFVAYASGTNLFRWDSQTSQRSLLVTAPEEPDLRGFPFEDVVIGSSGRFVLFQTPARGLVPGKTDSSIALYRLDTVDGSVTLINKSADGAASARDAGLGASVSVDGRRVVFTGSDPSLVDGLDGKAEHCLLWDEAAVPQISVVDASSINRPTTGGFAAVSISSQAVSGDSRYVAFSGIPSDGSTDLQQVWLRDRQTGSTSLLSFAPSTREPGNGSSRNAMISADGRWVAYETEATNLVAGVTDTNYIADIVLHDRAAGTNGLATLAKSGLATLRGRSSLRAMSGDGKWFVINIEASGFLNINGAFYADGSVTSWLWSRAGRTFRKIADSPAGSPVSEAHQAFSPAFSGDSKKLMSVFIGKAVFHDVKSNTDGSVTMPGARMLLLHDLETHQNDGYLVKEVGVGDPSITGAMLSSDGGKMVVARGTNTLLVDVKTGDETAFPFVGRVFSLTAGGGLAVCEERGSKTLQMLNTTTGSAEIISLPGDQNGRNAQITADGRFVVYRSLALPTIRPGGIGQAEVFLYDVAAKKTEALASRTVDGRRGDGINTSPLLTPDGSGLLFVSSKDNMAVNDFNGVPDLMLLPLPSANADSDGDGLPDAWEREHFGNLDQTAAGDPDQDGMSNLAEYLAGTDPAKSNSALVLSAPTVGAAGKHLLRWTAAAGKAYVLEFKENLEDAAWQAVPGEPSVDGDGLRLDADAPAEGRNRFYRVRLVTP